MTGARPRVALAVVAALTGAAALLAGGGPAPWPGAPDAAVVDPLVLATWIRDPDPGLRVVDLRDAEAFELLHVPGAIRLSPDSLRASRAAPGRLVVYAATDAEALRGAARLRAAGHGRVHVLRGGVLAWAREVYWPTLPADPTPAEVERFRVAADHARYFGGTPRREGSPAGATPPALASLEELVGEARRSGCGW